MDIKELIINSNFLDEIDQPIFVKDRSGIYIYCNQAFSNFLGIPTKKIISHTAFDVAPQAFAKIYTEADKALFESAGKQEYLAKVKAQSEAQEIKVIFKKSIIYDQNHNLSGFIGTLELHKNIVHDSISETHKLTEREIEALNLLAKGKSVKQIAAILQISRHTVTDHLKSIYLKLDVHSKNEAIFKALTFWAMKSD
jgi:DNA-binding CsgD family transcriptional regulator